MNPNDFSRRVTGGVQEPNAQSRQFARGCRDTFNALVAEGFSEPQALHIIGVMISANGRRGDTP
ncbi:hypothetical protein [Nocardia miyunensis]|uniref:hypothetical protein n=1 Tax=Nocardia miyunensis TaxID=282684 RepID=UPI0008323F30|nr:hypothetical protein [Nocardia miyunensis]